MLRVTIDTATAATDGRMLELIEDERGRFLVADPATSNADGMIPIVPEPDSLYRALGVFDAYSKAN